MIFFIISFAAGGSSPSLKASSLVRLMVAPRSAPFRSGTSASYTFLQVGIVPGFGLDVSQAHYHFAVGEYLCAVRVM
ncbi:hypothetical protein [Enterobacter oligotrophicus]|uniref:hypothetical protein n=1 Tax=Enterobacter oligotrophicus TaxID=2478464 RepID=UPI0028AD3523|nr:hypothetical protein [Enterobacter oligotrophicus]